MKGFRTAPQASRKERLGSMETQIKNLEMAIKISQMMTQQVMQNVRGMSEDLSKSYNLINELQYKLLAVQEVTKLDITSLTDVANRLRLKDFNEASDKEDEKEGLLNGDTVDEHSIIILTSTTNGGADAGIFRSRLKLAECGVPELIKAFMGQAVGTKATVALNGVDHEIQLLAIRQPQAVEAVEQTNDLPTTAPEAEQAQAQV